MAGRKRPIDAAGMVGRIDDLHGELHLVAERWLAANEWAVLTCNPTLGIAELCEAMVQRVEESTGEAGE